MSMIPHYKTGMGIRGGWDMSHEHTCTAGNGSTWTGTQVCPSFLPAPLLLWELLWASFLFSSEWQQFFGGEGTKSLTKIYLVFIFKPSLLSFSYFPHVHCTPTAGWQLCLVGAEVDQAAGLCSVMLTHLCTSTRCTGWMVTIAPGRCRSSPSDTQLRRGLCTEGAIKEGFKKEVACEQSVEEWLSHSQLEGTEMDPRCECVLAL